MKVLIISHLLGDFYFQTDKMSEKKKTSMIYLLWHVVLYVLSVYCMLIMVSGKWEEYICPVIIIGVSHFVLDFTKIKIEKKYANITKYRLEIFMLDQILHIIFLWILIQRYPFELCLNWLPVSLGFWAEKWNEFLVVSISVLLCGKPSAVIVALLFEKIPEIVHSAELIEEDGEVNLSAEQYENPKIGSWIGILEREIILVLGLLGQYGAIGFVLTAKSLARHKQLNNPSFAEKYLVGTLLSSFIALLNVAMCNWLI